MIIANLQVHGSTDPASRPYYTADLVEINDEGTETSRIPVQFSQNAGCNAWTVYDELTEDAYPIQYVGSSNKMNDITTWKDGDWIELGIRIPRP